MKNKILRLTSGSSKTNISNVSQTKKIKIKTNRNLLIWYAKTKYKQIESTIIITKSNKALIFNSPGPVMNSWIPCWIAQLNQTVTDRRHPVLKENPPCRQTCWMLRYAIVRSASSLRPSEELLKPSPMK